MRKKRIIAKAFLTAGLALAGVAWAQSDTALPERYEMKVVLESPIKILPFEILSAQDSIKLCRREPGVFGRRGDVNIESALPADMDVDSVGNIYINDPANERIQVFDSDGKYMRSIRVVEAYTMGSGESGWEALSNYKSRFALAPGGNIYVYDEIKNEVETIDMKGNVLGRESLVRKEKGKKRVVEFNEYRKEKDKSFVDYLITGSSTVYDEKGNRHAGKVFYRGKNIKFINGRLMYVKMGEKSLKIITNKDVIGINWVGRDKHQNDYFRITEDNGRSLTIKKYDINGKQMANIVIRKPNEREPQMIIKRMVDAQGNYYQLEHYNDKLYVRKWEVMK